MLVIAGIVTGVVAMLVVKLQATPSPKLGPEPLKFSSPLPTSTTLLYFAPTSVREKYSSDAFIMYGVDSGDGPELIRMTSGGKLYVFGREVKLSASERRRVSQTVSRSAL